MNRLIRRHTCFRCGGVFQHGEQFHSDAPDIVYHLRCYIAAVKTKDGL